MAQYKIEPPVNLAYKLVEAVFESGKSLDGWEVARSVLEGIVERLSKNRILYLKSADHFDLGSPGFFREGKNFHLDWEGYWMDKNAVNILSEDLVIEFHLRGGWLYQIRVFPAQ